MQFLILLVPYMNYCPKSNSFKETLDSIKANKNAVGFLRCKIIGCQD